MTKRSRVRTLRLLALGHPALSSSPNLKKIDGEFKRIEAAQRKRSVDGYMLSVLYVTRVLDTTLHDVLDAKGWLGHKSVSLGGYLIDLAKYSVLTGGEKDSYANRIVKKRNHYMHNAGAMPHGLVSDQLLLDMQECLTLVLRKT